MKEKKIKMVVRALSVKEPWASLIYSGEKTIETRKWKTDYRGSILICVSRNPKNPLSGLAICDVTLIDCRPMTEDDEQFAKCEIYDGAYSWVLKDIKKIIPFPIKGKLGLFKLDDHYFQQIRWYPTIHRDFCEKCKGLLKITWIEKNIYRTTCGDCDYKCDFDLNL